MGLRIEVKCSKEKQENNEKQYRHNKSIGFSEIFNPNKFYQ